MNFLRGGVSSRGMGEGRGGGEGGEGIVWYYLPTYHTYLFTCLP